MIAANTYTGSAYRLQQLGCVGERADGTGAAPAGESSILSSPIDHRLTLQQRRQSIGRCAEFYWMEGRQGEPWPARPGDVRCTVSLSQKAGVDRTVRRPMSCLLLTSS